MPRGSSIHASSLRPPLSFSAVAARGCTHGRTRIPALPRVQYRRFLPLCFCHPLPLFYLSHRRLPHTVLLPSLSLSLSFSSSISLNRSTTTATRLPPLLLSFVSPARRCRARDLLDHLERAKGDSCVALEMSLVIPLQEEEKEEEEEESGKRKKKMSLVDWESSDRRTNSRWTRAIDERAKQATENERMGERERERERERSGWYKSTRLARGVDERVTRSRNLEREDYVASILLSAEERFPSIRRKTRAIGKDIYVCFFLFFSPSFFFIYDKRNKTSIS